jgi:hypothetical protein
LPSGGHRFQQIGGRIMSEKPRQPTQAGAPVASDRGKIQKGYTGDKVPGFDPAAAPMETDAEAGATNPAHPGAVPPRAPSHLESNPNASSHGTAMRSFEDERSAPLLRTSVVLLVLVVVILIAGWIFFEFLGARS